MRKELIAFNDPASSVSEMFKTLRTNIQFMNSDKELKTLLVSSTLPGEGKSWTAANLGVTFAQAGKKVLIIDADMRKGRQFNIFEVLPTPGLSNYLSGVVDGEKKERNIEDFIQKTIVENLYVLPAGNVPPNPSELLVSEKMIELNKRVKELYDITIFDGTPSLLVTDAPILSRIVDSTILVTAHNETKIDNVAKVKKAIENVGGKVAGVVVNKIPVSARKYEGTYYYGGYGSVKPVVVDEKQKTHHEFFGNIWNKKNKFDDFFVNDVINLKDEPFKFIKETEKEEKKEETQIITDNKPTNYRNYKEIIEINNSKKNTESTEGIDSSRITSTGVENTITLENQNNSSNIKEETENIVNSHMDNIIEDIFNKKYSNEAENNVNKEEEPSINNFKAEQENNNTEIWKQNDNTETWKENNSIETWQENNNVETELKNNDFEIEHKTNNLENNSNVSDAFEYNANSNEDNSVYNRFKINDNNTNTIHETENHNEIREKIAFGTNEQDQENKILSTTQDVIDQVNKYLEEERKKLKNGGFDD